MFEICGTGALCRCRRKLSNEYFIAKLYNEICSSSWKLTEHNCLLACVLRYSHERTLWEVYIIYSLSVHRRAARFPRETKSELLVTYYYHCPAFCEFSFGPDIIVSTWLPAAKTKTNMLASVSFCSDQISSFYIILILIRISLFQIPQVEPDPALSRDDVRKKTSDSAASDFPRGPVRKKPTQRGLASPPVVPLLLCFRQLLLVEARVLQREASGFLFVHACSSCSTSVCTASTSRRAAACGRAELLG